LRSAHMFTKT